MSHRRNERGSSGRLVSIGGNMSRVLRRGDGRNENPMGHDLQDGGSILVSALVGPPAFRHLYATMADIVKSSTDKGRENKMRIDLPQSADGERVRAYQGHTPNVARPTAPMCAVGSRLNISYIALRMCATPPLLSARDLRCSLLVVRNSTSRRFFTARGRSNTSVTPAGGVGFGAALMPA